MDDDKTKKARILRKPIHDKATRKVQALPQLIEQSRRPDGQPANVEVSEAQTVAVDSVDGVDVGDGGLFDDLFSDITFDD